MNYLQFIEKIKICTDANIENENGKKIIKINWLYNIEPEPFFKDFNLIVSLFRNDIKVLYYEQLKDLLIQYEIYTSYHDRRPITIAIKKCYLDKIYTSFIDLCIISAKCSMIVGEKLINNQKRDIICGEMAVTTAQTEPICVNCLEKFEKNDPSLLDSRLKFDGITISNNIVKQDSIQKMSTLKKYYADKEFIDLTFILTKEQKECLKNPKTAPSEIYISCKKDGYVDANESDLLTPLGRLLLAKIKSNEAAELLANEK